MRRLSEQARSPDLDPTKKTSPSQRAFCFLAILKVPKLPVLRSREKKTFDRMEATFGGGMRSEGSILSPENCNRHKRCEGTLGCLGQGVYSCQSLAARKAGKTLSSE